MRSPSSFYSLLHLDIGLLRDSLKSVEDEQIKYMSSLKLQNEKVIDAIARLEILAGVVDDISMMDYCSARVQPGAATMSELLTVPLEEKKSPRQSRSGKIRGDDDVICGFHDSVTGKDNDRDELTTAAVDTHREKLSTSRPSLRNKRVTNRESKNVDLDDLANSDHDHHNHLVSIKARATDEESPHLASPVFHEKGCFHETSLLHGTNVADKVVKTMVLSGDVCGAIVGRNGIRIQKLQRVSGARIDIIHLSGDKEGKVVIEGSTDKVRRALEMIENIVGGSVIARLTVPDSKNPGILIGKKGSRIQELERITKTVINFRRLREHENRQIIVKGFRDQVEKAIGIIQQKIGVEKYVFEK